MDIGQVHKMYDSSERMTLMNIKERKVVLNLYSKDDLIELIIAMEEE